MKRKIIIKLIFLWGLIILTAVGYTQENRVLIDCLYKFKDKKGKEIGYLHYIFKDNVVYQGTVCYEILKEDEFSGGWLFAKNRMEGKEKAYISKEEGILYFERQEIHNVSLLGIKGKGMNNSVGIKDKNKMLIEQTEKVTVNEKDADESGKVSKKEIDLNNIDCLIYELDIPIIRPIINLTVGEKREFMVFDPEFQIIRKVNIEIKREEKIKILGSEQEAYVIEGKSDGRKLTVWLSKDGKITLKRKDQDGEMELFLIKMPND